MTIILRRHFTVRRLTQTSVKYIFPESLIIADYDGIFINIKKFKVFQIYRAVSQSTEVHLSSSFPVAFDPENSINIAMSSRHLSLKNGVGKF